MLRHTGLALIRAAAMVGAIWVLVWLAGGTGSAVPHLIYFPILYASIRTGAVGGIATGVLGGLTMASIPIVKGQVDSQTSISVIIRSFSFVTAGAIMGNAVQSLKARARQVEESAIESAAVLMNTIEANHRYTAGHTTRVSQISRMLGSALGLPDDELSLLTTGSLLHDVGKVALPREILDKPGRLTAEEFALVKRHPVTGDHILSEFKYPGIERVRDIVRHHHERLDGSGYPDGLRGDRISLPARIVAVADVYEALTSDRSYRAAMSASDALELIQRETAAGLFDPRVVRELHRLVESGEI